MTPEANGRVSCAAQATAARALALYSAEVLARFFPNSIDENEQRDQTRIALVQALAKVRQDLSGMSFSELTPVESDMWNQEVLEAFDQLSEEFLRAAGFA